MENSISLEQFKTIPEYQEFIKENPETGLLKVQAFTADQAIPLPNTKVFITKQIGDNDVLFFSGETNSSGIIDQIELPAPNGEYNIESFEAPKYTTYKLIASNDQYKMVKEYEVAMFGNVRVLQYVKFQPDMNGGE